MKASFVAVDPQGRSVLVEILGDGRTPPPGSGIDCGTTPEGVAFVVFDIASAGGRPPVFGVPPSLTPDDASSSSSPLASTRTGEPLGVIENALSGGQFFAERYLIEQSVGRGGMGEVYRARDTKLNRDVALKVVRYSSTSEEARIRASQVLVREARAAATLSHPNVVTLFDVGEVSGTAYLAMEYIEGKPLRACIGDWSVPFESRVRWLREIASGLAAAHARGIAHRDVKPENVMITAGGTAKVLDFGIAKEVSASGVTLDGRIVGSPLYMAPEQTYGSNVDARCDQYAWALVAHEVLTGRHPFIPFRGRPPEVRLPAPFDVVVKRALSQDREDRYPSMNAALEALSETKKAEATSPQGEPRAPASSLPRWFAAVAGVAAVVGVGLLALRPATQKPIETGRPDAVATLGAAKQLWRDASLREALRRIEQATEIDPTFAQAHLRYALFADVTPASREHFHQAAQFRDRLSPSERAILSALEPSLREPCDVLETRKRLEALVKASPDELELLLAVASRYLLAWDGAGALPYAERALRATKEPLAVVSLYRGRALAKLGRFEEARAEYDRCFLTSPSATSCLHARASIDANDGRCDSAEQLGRRLTAIDKTSPQGPHVLAGALFAEAESVPSARAALEPWWATLSTAEGEWLRQRDESHLRVLAGDFGGAEQSISAWERSATTFSDADHHGSPALFRLLVALELGKTEEAGVMAHRYFDESRAWSQGQAVVFDIEAYRLLYLSGALSKDDFEAFRKDWLARTDANWRGVYDPGLYKWYEAYVDPVRDADDARLALAERPQAIYDQEIMQAQANEKLGVMYSLAGQTQKAVEHLRRSATACTIERPIHQTMGILQYGHALARAGDTAAACVQYGRVLRRWGKEPRSSTAASARRSARELRCALPDELLGSTSDH